MWNSLKDFVGVLVVIFFLYWVVYLFVWLVGFRDNTSIASGFVLVAYFGISGLFSVYKLKKHVEKINVRKVFIDSVSVGGFSPAFEYLSPYADMGFIVLDAQSKEVIIGGGVGVGFDSRRFFIKDIISCSLVENDKVVAGDAVADLGMVGLGVLAFGAAGLAVGVSALGSRNVIKNISLVFKLDDLANPRLVFNFLPHEVSRGDSLHIKHLKIAQQWMDRFDVMIHRQKY